jgi:phosphonate transport system ATP-binding protein
VGRVVGLRRGSIVYDGSPEGLTPDVLTEIYGEEDWALAARAEEADEETAPAGLARDRDRLAGLR